MRNHIGFSLTSLALLAPLAVANNDNDDLDRVHVPAFNEVKTTVKPGKGITFDAGDDFLLNLYHRLQVAWQFSSIDNGVQDIHTFRVRRARQRAKGHVFSPKTQYQLYIEYAGTPAILDAWINQEVWSNEQWKVNVRGGAQKVLYSKEFTGSSGNLELVDRSIANRTLAANRSTGVLGMISGLEGKFHAHMGLFNSSEAAGSVFPGPNTNNADNELNYTAGARYDFNNDMGGESYSQGDLERMQGWNASVHGGLWIGNEAGVATPDVETFAFNIGGSFKGWGAHALAEFYMHTAEADAAGATDHTVTGWNIQGSYIFPGGSGGATGDAWGVAGRVSMVDVDTIDPGATQFVFPATAGTTLTGTGALAGAGDVLEFTLGVNKFFNGHARKVQADITFQEVNPSGAGAVDSSNIIFRVQATLSV